MDFSNKTNKVALFSDFRLDNKNSEKIIAEQLSDSCPTLFKKEDGLRHSSIASVPFAVLLSGEFILPCSIQSYVHNIYKSKTSDEIVDEFELLWDKLTDFCGSESDFIKLLNFSLALCDCLGNVCFGCESAELHAKLVRLHERVKNMTSAQLLFVRNMSLIKNKSGFVSSVADHADYRVEQIRMTEI